MTMIKAILQQLKKSHREEKGLAILSILAIILVITLYGTTNFMNIKTDLQHTFKDFDAIKAGYAADAAMAWAITVAQQEPAFTCPTHKANGTDVYAWNETGKAPDGCDENPDFTNNRFKLDTSSYAGISTDGNGWLQTSLNTSHGDQTLTGADSETLKFKLWFPTDSTMRITSIAIVNGKADTVELIGDISN